MAPYNIVFLGALLLFGSTVRAQEPQIFFNLTFDEHLAKVQEHSTNGIVTDNSDLPWEPALDVNEDEIENAVLSRRGRFVNLGKRDPVGGESRNDAVANDMLQALHGLCEERFGQGWRATKGHCAASNIKVFACGHPTSIGSERYLRFKCPDKNECTVFTAVNFRDKRANFPVCGPRIEVDKRKDEGRHVEWQGAWTPESPKSPGTYDSFAQMAGSLNGYFDFAGTSSQGKGFASHGSGHSWSCISCPGGQLTVTHTEGPTWAVGYTSVHV